MLERLRPLRDQVVIKLMPESHSELVPDQFRDRSRTGEVVAVGPGKVDMKHGRRIPMRVKVGDRVRFSLNDFEDGDYTLIQEGDIFGFLAA